MEVSTDGIPPRSAAEETRNDLSDALKKIIHITDTIRFDIQTNSA